MKKSVLVLIFVFMLFSVSAVDDCWITTITDSNCPTPVVALYDTTNSHGGLYGAGGGSHKLCCDFSASYATCESLNGVVSLSSHANAHAEIFNSGTYSQDICFEDIECLYHSGTGGYSEAIMAAFPIEVLSLSSFTNGHIGAYNDYRIKISCRDFNDVVTYWEQKGSQSVNQIDFDGTPTTVRMVLDNSPLTCSANFSIYQQNMSGGSALAAEEEIAYFCNWDPETGEDKSYQGTQCCTAPDYIFKDIIINETFMNYLNPEEDDIYGIYFTVNQGNGYNWTSGLLTINDTRVEEPEDPVAYWAEYLPGVGFQEVASKTIADETYLPYTIYLIMENTGLNENDEIEIEIFEDDEGEGIWPNPDEQFQSVFAYVDSEGNANTSWQITEDIIEYVSEGLTESEGNSYEFKFNFEAMNPLLNFTISQAQIQCIGINYCSNYNDSSSCEADSPCNVANNQTSLPPGYSCEDSSINCYCYWNDAGAGECNSGWSKDGIGSCNYDEDMESDTCDDGFLSYNWTADWMWDPLNVAVSNLWGDDGVEDGDGWHNDPGLDSEVCEDGAKIISCPAMIQLPFFNVWNLVGVIVLIILIYFFFGIKDRKKFGKKKVSKKK